MIKYFIVFTAIGFAIGRFIPSPKVGFSYIALIAFFWGARGELVWGLAALGELFLGYFIATVFARPPNGVESAGSAFHSQNTPESVRAVTDMRNPPKDSPPYEPSGTLGMDTRITRKEAEIVAVYYVMSKCRAVVNNDEAELSDLDKELLSVMRKRAEAPIPLFGAKKQSMLARRDIALHTRQLFTDSISRGHYRIARNHLSEGVQSELRLFAGDSLWRLTEHLEEILERMDNPFKRDMQPVEQFMNAMRFQEFTKQGILAGLVVPSP